mmetsp:Transcript_25052/g.46170  ORF Transcript_25052/g.46170 Transcript_25052/m.46170 type:complete len:238 (+) Transcript_25052:120-833(+)
MMYQLLCVRQNASRLQPCMRRSKKKKPTAKSGGGFGSKTAATASITPVSADKHALEAQWDLFASITNLELVPPGDVDDEDYKHFLVTDVFVRVGSSDVNSDDGNDKPGTGWYRTGKAVTAGETDIQAALTLQKGLIFWTAVHMWPQLAAKGKAAVNQLQLGYMPASMYMAAETDTALDEEEAGEVQMWRRAAVQGVLSMKDIGFRPDFNPSGFTYKRREKAAMKKKKSAMDEIAEAS